MSNQIEITFSVEDAAAFKAWQRQQAAAAKMKKELDALKKSGNVAGSSLAGVAANAGRTALAAVGALTGVGGAVAAIMAVANQLKAEFANYRARQADAAGTQIGWGKAFAGLQRAAGGLMDRQKLQDKTLQAAIRAGQDPAEFAKGVETTLQAKGPVVEEDVDRAIQAAESVAKFYPEVSSEDRVLLSGSTGDITGAYKLSTEESLGLLQNVAQAARVEGPQFMAQNAAPAMAQMAMYGESPQFAGSLFATTTNRTVDREGATSKLIDLKLLERLKEAFPEEKTGLKTGEQRLAFLQDNPQFQKAFLDGGEILGKKLGEAEIGRSAGRPFLEDLMKKDSDSNKMLQENKGVVGDRQVWQGQHDKVKAQVDADPNMRLGRLQAAGKAAVAQIQLENPIEGQIAVSREILKEITKAAGLLDIEQKAAMTVFEMNTGLGGAVAIEEVARQLDRLAQSEDHIQVPDGPAYSAGYGSAAQVMKTVPNPEATNEQRMKAGRLRLTRDELLKAAPEQGQRSAVVPQHVQLAMDSAKQAVVSLENDKSITPEDASAAREKITAARGAVRATEGIVEDKLLNEMKNLVFRMSQVAEAQIKSNEAQIKATEQNTKATEQNTKNTGSSAPAGATAPAPATANGIPQRPRNNQASRMLGKGSPLIGGMA